VKSYIVLFRGINVGGKNIVPMKELKSLLEGHGYDYVKTYIQSGNLVVKTMVNPSDHIGLLVLSKFGFNPEIMAIDKSKFNALVASNPFQSFEGKTVHFYFCAKKPSLNKTKLNSVIASSEAYELKGKVFYLHAPDGIGRSKLVSNIESCLGVAATGRNLNTVSKLYEIVNTE